MPDPQIGVAHLEGPIRTLPGPPRGGVGVVPRTLGGRDIPLSQRLVHSLDMDCPRPLVRRVLPASLRDGSMTTPTRTPAARPNVAIVIATILADPLLSVMPLPFPIGVCSFADHAAPALIVG